MTGFQLGYRRPKGVTVFSPLSAVFDIVDHTFCWTGCINTMVLVRGHGNTMVKNLSPTSEIRVQILAGPNGKAGMLLASGQLFTVRNLDQLNVY